MRCIRRLSVITEACGGEVHAAGPEQLILIRFTVTQLLLNDGEHTLVRGLMITMLRTSRISMSVAIHRLSMSLASRARHAFFHALDPLLPVLGCLILGEATGLLDLGLFFAAWVNNTCISPSR